MLHVLKCWPESFSAIVSGTKRFEVRADDRGGYAVDHILHLHEWEPAEDYDPVKNRDAGEYTGRELVVHVTYVLRPPAFGLLLPETVVMGFLTAKEGIAADARKRELAVAR